MVSVRINAKFKDTLFRMIFGGKKELLDLYNAINHSNYRNPDDLIVTTIGDVLYMGMKTTFRFSSASISTSMKPRVPGTRTCRCAVSSTLAVSIRLLWRNMRWIFSPSSS